MNSLGYQNSRENNPLFQIFILEKSIFAIGLWGPSRTNLNTDLLVFYSTIALYRQLKKRKIFNLPMRLVFVENLIYSATDVQSD